MATRLWYYNQDYLHSIKNIMDTHADYSIIGDVNLDGIVSGNGTGQVTPDDVAAFVAGWRYNNGTGNGTITSWKNGDLNRDGKTDVLDFLEMRAALNGPTSGAVLSARFGGMVSPEPSAVVLAAVGTLLAALARHRRRSALV